MKPKYNKKTIKSCLEYWDARGAVRVGGNQGLKTVDEIMDSPGAYCTYDWRGEAVSEEEFVERTLKFQAQTDLDKALGIKI